MINCTCWTCPAAECPRSSCRRRWAAACCRWLSWTTTPTWPRVRAGFVSFADLANPAVKTVPLGFGGASRVAVSGRYAYVVTNPPGIAVVDRTTPGSPRQVGFLSRPAAETDIRDGRAYVLASDGKLDVVDVTAPASRRLDRVIDLDGFAATQVAVTNAGLVVVSRSDGLPIVDPGQAQPIIGQWTGNGWSVRNPLPSGSRVFFSDPFTDYASLTFKTRRSPWRQPEWPTPVWWETSPCRARRCWAFARASGAGQTTAEGCAANGGRTRHPNEPPVAGPAIRRGTLRSATGLTSRTCRRSSPRVTAGST